MNSTPIRKQASPPLIVIFFAFFGIWCLANLPALEHAWWNSDDFPLITDSWQNTSSFYMSQGRPLLSLWANSLHIDDGPTKEVQNAILRIIQGTFHVVTATLIVLLLSKSENIYKVSFSVLPFLIWPFNGEAVLWRVGAIVSIAAMISLIGLILITNKKSHKRASGFGVLLIILSMLSHQVGALCALIVWIIWIVIGDLNLHSNERTFIFRTGGLLFLGYLLGGMFSFLIAHSFTGLRANFAINVLDKAKYLVDLNHLFIGGYFYPKWLTFIQFAIFFTSILFIVFLSIKKDGNKIAIIRLGLTGTMLIVPWVTLLIIAEDWPSWRVMYLAPLIFTCLILSIFRLTEGALNYERTIRIASCGTFLILLFGYARISWINSSEYLHLFQEDLHTLQRIEKAVYQNDLSKQICVVTSADYVRTWNPYGLRFVHGDSKLSAFIVPWAVPSFVSLFSDLNVTDNSSIKAEGIKDCKKTTNNESFLFFVIYPEKVLCVCP